MGPLGTTHRSPGGVTGSGGPDQFPLGLCRPAGALGLAVTCSRASNSRAPGYPWPRRDDTMSQSCEMVPGHLRPFVSDGSVQFLTACDDDLAFRNASRLAEPQTRGMVPSRAQSRPDKARPPPAADAPREVIARRGQGLEQPMTCAAPGTVRSAAPTRRPMPTWPPPRSRAFLAQSQGRLRPKLHSPARWCDWLVSAMVNV